MPPSQLHRVARMVVSPPGLSRIVRSVVADGRLSACIGLLLGYRPSRFTIDQHFPSSVANLAEEIEVLYTEEEGRIG